VRPSGASNYPVDIQHESTRQAPSGASGIRNPASARPAGSPPQPGKNKGISSVCVGGIAREQELLANGSFIQVGKMFGTIPFDAMPVGFYHAILNSVRDPFNIIDKDFRILWSNDAGARFHQQNQPEIIGKYCYEIFRRGSRPCPACPVRVVFDSGKPCIMERAVVLPDGSSKHGDVRAYPVFDSKGNVAYAIQIMIDITKRKLKSARQKRHVESLETTIRQFSGKNVRALLKYEGEKVEHHLTERETEVLGLMANGLTNVEIGSVLAISHHTVKSHAVNIFVKLGVKDRTQAATWAVRHKLV
jgi:PAS domain S-box-containing protein